MAQQGLPLTGASINVLGITFKENCPELLQNGEAYEAVSLVMVIDIISNGIVPKLLIVKVSDAGSGKREDHSKLN
mgnify:CR=1 FL=1